MSERSRSGEKVLRGIPVSEGVCRDRIVVLGKPHDAIPRHAISEAELPQEIQRLERALTKTRQQILDVQRRVANALGAKDASIFDAHLLVLDDPTLIDEVNRVIHQQKVNDEYLRERAADMRDVTTRVLDNLLGRADEAGVRKLKEPCIIIAYDLSPSTTALLDKKLVRGFGTDIGSKTSHTAIMARSLEIPAVVGLRDASRQLESGQDVLLDGFNGLLILNPTDQTLFEYGQLVRKHVTLEEKLRDVYDKPAVTLDGKRIILSANVEQPGDTEAVLASGAEG